MVEPTKVFEELTRQGVTDATHSDTTYEFQGRHAGQNITVVVHDYGPGSGTRRYSVDVTAESGRTIASNNWDTVADALGALRWNELE